MALLPWALLPSHHEGPFRPPEPCCRCPSKEQRRLFPSGCQAMSVYSGSDYTESNCYDQKQVEADLSIEISSNASGQQHHCNHLHPPKDPHHELHYNADNRPLSTSLSGTGTGSQTSVRRSGWSKLYCKPQCFKGNLYLMFFSRMSFFICPGRCLVPRDSVGSKFLPQWSTYRWSLGFLSRETLLIGFLSWETLRIGFFYAFVWQGGQWWTRYQPVSYKLESRFSKSNQFKHSLFYNPARHFDLMHKKIWKKENRYNSHFKTIHICM